MKEQDFVSVLLRMSRSDAEQLAAKPDAFKAMQGRAANGQIESVLKAAFERFATDAKPSSEEVIAVRVSMARQQATSFMAEARALAVDARFDQMSDDLAAMKNRLEGFEVEIGRINQTASATLAAQKRIPMAALQAAWSSARMARRRGDMRTVASAAREAHSAAMQIMGFAISLADHEKGLPVVLKSPSECVDLMRQAHKAMLAAATIYLCLGEREYASALLREHASEMASARDKIRAALVDEDTLDLRVTGQMADDAAVIRAGQQIAACVTQAYKDADFIAVESSEVEGTFSLGTLAFDATISSAVVVDATVTSGIGTIDHSLVVTGDC